MAAGRKTAELASEPWQIGCGGTLCKDKVWASLEFPANLCCAFHNVRLSITQVLGLEATHFQLYRYKAVEPAMEEQQVQRENPGWPAPVCAWGSPRNSNV